MTLLDAPAPAVEAEPPPPVESSAFSPTRRRSHMKLVLLALDGLALALAWSFATTALAVGDGASRSLIESLLLVAVVTTGGLIGLSRLGLYLSRVNAIRTAEAAGILKVAALSVVGFVASARLFDLPLHALEAVGGGALAGALLLLVRSGVRIYLQAQRRDGLRCRRVVVIGTNDEAAEVVELISQHPEFGIRIQGVIGDRASGCDPTIEPLLLGPADNAIEIMRAVDANGAIIAISALAGDDLNSVARNLLSNGMHVQVTSALRGIDHRRLRAQPIGHEPLFFVEPATLSLWQLAVKRLSDIVLASILLVLSAPIQIVLAALVKVTDGGPVMFHQERVGRHGRTFHMIKLRTMVVDAEARLAELQAQSERTGPLFKMDHDPRFTRIGRIMDATSLNELPQLWNVLRGEMSLVGPRPALPSETAAFDEELHARHQVRPGITGLWQVEARDNPSFAAYRRYDLFYVENWSLALDFVILLGTAETVLARAVRQITGRTKPAGEASASSEVAPLSKAA